MNAPTKFYTQHHAVLAPAIDGRAFRPYWKRETQLDRLRTDKAITETVWRAGVEFRSIAEMALAEQWGSQWLDERSVGRSGSDIAVARRLDAIAVKARIGRKLGAGAVVLLELHTVDDLPWAELGRRYCVHASTARRRTIAKLCALAEVIWQ